MHIILDARMAFHTGIGRYIRDLCQALLTQPSEPTLSLLIDPLHTTRVQQEIGATQMIPFPAKIYSLAEQVHSLRLHRAHAHQASVFHYPHYNIPWFLPRNSVVTVHDVTHFQFPEYFGTYRVKLAFRLLRRAVRRAGHVIAVSQATQHALEALIPEATGKTTVVHHGVANHFRPLPEPTIDAFKQRHNLGRFFLYLGNAKPHKNVGRLLQAFSRVHSRCSQMELVLLGVNLAELDPMSASLLQTLSGVRTFSDIPDTELIRWYNAAEAFVFPSLNEGFGLPPLEAMACGTPVIGSEITALHEVLGTAGVFINPQNVEALAQVMEEMAASSELRQRLHIQGQQRARLFTWPMAAAKTLQIYHVVANRYNSSA